MRKIAIFIGGILFLTASVTNLFAVDFSTISKDAQAKYAKFEEKVKDMYIVQDTVVTTGGQKMPVMMKMYVKGGKFRAETTAAIPQGQNTGEGMPIVTTIIHDGKDTWMISPFMGKTKLNSAQEQQYREKSNWWTMIAPDARVTGTENISGRTCYVIESKQSNQYPFSKLWVDQDKLILVKSETNSYGDSPMTSIMSEFRESAGGWEMPYKIDVYQNGQLISMSKIKSIETNKGISDDLFDANKVQAKEFNIQDYMKQMQQQK